MVTSTYQIEISKRDRQIAELLQRNKELEEENKRLKELLHNKGKSKESKKPEFKIDYSVNQNLGKSHLKAIDKLLVMWFLLKGAEFNHCAIAHP